MNSQSLRLGGPFGIALIFKMVFWPILASYCIQSVEIECSRKVELHYNFLTIYQSLYFDCHLVLIFRLLLVFSVGYDQHFIPDLLFPLFCAFLICFDSYISVSLVLGLIKFLCVLLLSCVLISVVITPFLQLLCNGSHPAAQYSTK